MFYSFFHPRKASHNQRQLTNDMNPSEKTLEQKQILKMSLLYLSTREDPVSKNSSSHYLKKEEKKRGQLIMIAFPSQNTSNILALSMSFDSRGIEVLKVDPRLQSANYTYVIVMSVWYSTELIIWRSVNHMSIYSQYSTVDSNRCQLLSRNNLDKSLRRFCM